MPKRYELMDNEELEKVLDSDQITDEDATRIQAILESREAQLRRAKQVVRIQGQLERGEELEEEC